MRRREAFRVKEEEKMLKRLAKVTGQSMKVIVQEKDIWAGKDVEPTVVQAVDQAEDDGGMVNADVGARLEELTSGEETRERSGEIDEGNWGR